MICWYVDMRKIEINQTTRRAEAEEEEEEELELEELDKRDDEDWGQDMIMKKNAFRNNRNFAICVMCLMRDARL